MCEYGKVLVRNWDESVEECRIISKDEQAVVVQYLDGVVQVEEAVHFENRIIGSCN